jgi:saccharopine dehydrogenase (NAD+, L-lysine-forming)
MFSSIVYFPQLIITIYDFEYFVNNQNQRLISFGYYAGLTGCILGLLQYIKKLFGLNILNLTYWETIDVSTNKNTNENTNENTDIIIDKIFEKIDINLFKNLNTCIIGNGNCASGVKYILEKFNINYIILHKNDTKTNLENYDLVFNCILLDENYNEIWFGEKTIFTKPIIIVDISCDNLKLNNPIQLYNKNTTWKNPIFKYNQYVDIIAIDNLPSLLPRESSIYFSKKCIELLLQLNNDNNNYWKNNEKIFYNMISNY